MKGTQASKRDEFHEIFFLVQTFYLFHLCVPTNINILCSHISRDIVQLYNLWVHGNTHIYIYIYTHTHHLETTFQSTALSVSYPTVGYLHVYLLH